MRKHLSVFALCIRQKLWKTLLILAAMAAASVAAFAVLGVQRAWGGGYGPGNTVLWGLDAAAYLGVMLVCCGSGRGAKCGYTLQRLQISERWALIWDALAASCCFFLLYFAEILTVFALAVWYQCSADYALGAQGVFLMLARSSYLHGLLPLGEGIVWVRNALYLLCAGLCCAAAACKGRDGKRAVASIALPVFLATRLPVQLGAGSTSSLWLIVALIWAGAAFGSALYAAHNGKRREDDEIETDAP